MIKFALITKPEFKNHVVYECEIKCQSEARQLNVENHRLLFLYLKDNIRKNSQKTLEFCFQKSSEHSY